MASGLGLISFIRLDDWNEYNIFGLILIQSSIHPNHVLQPLVVKNKGREMNTQWFNYT